MSKVSRSERTRGEILDAAWDLIAARGAEVSMAEIAEAAGITRQSIYVHFGSRGGLLLALVRRTDERERIVVRFRRALETEGPAKRLDACLSVWFDFVPKIFPVAKDLIRLRTHDEAAASAWDDRMQELLQLFEILIRGLRSDKALASHWNTQRAVDLLWTFSSVQSWEMLVMDRGWSKEQASKEIRYVLSRLLLG